ncbi:MAG: methyltransferase domain-containing protein [archaeon]
MLKIMYKLKNKALCEIAKISNYVNYKNKRITKFEYDLKKRFLKKTQQFGVTEFYQSYPPLYFPGTRNTLCRFQIYNLKNKLNKNQEILDIGGNIGFFSAYLSKFVKQIDLIEYNKELSEIGNILIKKEKIKNMSIINKDFKIFKTTKKYDVVLSLAIHQWVNLKFEDYIERINFFLKKNGVLLIESHFIFDKSGDRIYSKLKKIKEFKILQKGIIDDDNGRIREFFWLKKV